MYIFATSHYKHFLVEKETKKRFALSEKRQLSEKEKNCRNSRAKNFVELFPVFKKRRRVNKKVKDNDKNQRRGASNKQDEQQEVVKRQKKASGNRKKRRDRCRMKEGGLRLRDRQGAELKKEKELRNKNRVKESGKNRQ